MSHLQEPVIIIKQFYKTEQQFNSFYSRLKLHICPCCNLAGFLILHGFLYGYSEQGTVIRIKRGHRIFCSNRDKKQGCGKTFSIMNSGFIKNCMISATSIWKFLNKIKNGRSLANAFRQSGSDMKESSIYRIFREFKRKQSRIRTFLTQIKDPPEITHTNNPAIQTICHLASVFEDNACPISQFQYDFQTSFF